MNYRIFDCRIHVYEEDYDGMAFAGYVKITYHVRVMARDEKDAIEKATREVYKEYTKDTIGFEIDKIICRLVR